MPSVVRQEKVHQNLLEGVEHFDKATMKPTQTQEKNPLPDPEGRWHGGGLETCWLLGVLEMVSWQVCLHVLRARVGKIWHLGLICPDDTFIPVCSSILS
jgi:hypothetical protein